jgi:K+-transporting ATPase ATPase C chain
MGRRIFNCSFERRSFTAKNISYPISNSSVAFCCQYLLACCHLFRNIQLMKNQIRPALTIFAMLTIITGVIYPLVVTGISQIIFPSQSNGSIIAVDDKAAGSELIGQQFDDPKYFWGRVSAVEYNADLSSGSNYGPLNPALLEAVRARIDALQAADPDNTLPIPVDLVTASASGLDPHISVAAALYQVQRVASARGLSEADIQSLVEQHTEGRQFGVFGEPRVNVLLLNLALDGLQ